MDACACLPTSPVIQFCAEHHAYWLDGRRLTSVTQVIKSTWPIKPDFSAADPAVVENASIRGVEVDGLISQWLTGKLDAIPADTREDSVELFQKFTKWWNASEFAGCEVECQKVVYDDEIAGTIDLMVRRKIGRGFLTRYHSYILDIKTTYNLEKTYQIQVGAYEDLACCPSAPNYVDHVGIVHLTKRFDEPKLVMYDTSDCQRYWEATRRMWSVVRELAPKAMEVTA